VVVTVTTGGVVSTTVTEHVAEASSGEVPHCTWTSVVPSAYGLPGAHVVANPPAHVATAVQATSAVQLDESAETVGARHVMTGEMRQAVLHPSPLLVFPSSQASPGSRTPFPQARWSV
jgi:hypothetical protein